MRISLAATVILGGLSLAGCVGAEVDADDPEANDEAALTVPYASGERCR